MSLRASGVEIIDHLVGGIAPGLPVVLAGPSGSGRTVLCLELARRALDRGEVVAYLCNEPPALLLQQAATLDLELSPYLATGQFVLLELDAEIGGRVRTHGSRALVEAVLAEEPRIDVVIFDPFNTLLSELVDETQLRGVARSFAEAAATLDCVLSVEAERLALQPAHARVIAEVCGSYIALERGDGSKRSARVEKNRGGAGTRAPLDFKIGAGGARVVAAKELREDPDPQRLFEASVADDRPDASAGLERPKLLIADADAPLREQLRKWLSDRYDVATAADGFEALTSLLSHMPDLVIVDLEMPRVSGFELLSALQRTAPGVRSLVLTRHTARAGDRLGPLVLGASDVMTRPPQRFELLHRIDLLLRVASAPTVWMDPEEAAAVFACPTATRQLPDADFRQRLERAQAFGEKHALPSSLLYVSSGSVAAHECLLAACDEVLRFEDCVLPVEPQTAVLLLVAAEPDALPHIIGRLGARAAALQAGAPRRIRDSWRWRVQPVSDVARPADWDALCEHGAELEPAPDAGAP